MFNILANLERQTGQKPQVILTFILILASGLYLYQINHESLWIDELYSVHDAQGLPNTFSFERPLYYILLRIWMWVDTGEVWMRGLSILFGLGSVFLIYRLGRYLGGEFVGLLSALFLALSPLCINFAQMVRMYEMAMCIGLGGSLALINALEEPTFFTIFRWAILRILMLFTTPITATLLLSDMIIIIGKFHKQPRLLWMLFKFLLLICALFIPFLIATINQRTNLLDRSPPLSFSLSTLMEDMESKIKLIVGKLKKITAFPFPSTSKIMGLFYQIYSFILWYLLALALLFNNQRSIKLFCLATWAFVPSAINLLFKPGLFATDRYILFIVPYFLILLAIGFKKVCRSSSSQSFLAISITIVYLLAVSIGLVRYYTVQDRQDWRGMIQEISNNEQPGDIIILGSAQSGGASDKSIRALTYYYKGSATWQRQPRACTSQNYLISNLKLMPNRVWLICDLDSAKAKTFSEKLSNYFDIQSDKKFTNWGFDQEDSFFQLYLLAPY